MIYVEDKLESAFATLPTLQDLGGTNYQPVFDAGSHEDLLRLLWTNTGKVNVYPLVWLETPYLRKGKDERPNMRLKFFLATLADANQTNKQRREISFKNMLVPLYENVITAMSQSGFIRFLNEERNLVAWHYNYGVKENTESEVTDIWDVIVFERDIEMTDCPLKTINY